MIPVPFPCNPGDKLRVTSDRPWGTELVTGDLVTVEKTGIKTEGGLPIPVVVVFTAHGRQILGLDAVEPYTPPDYTPAEPDDVVDAFFFGILGEDTDLREWAVKARNDLAANDPDAATEPPGAVATEETPAPRSTQVGPGYEFIDGDGDRLEVTYREKPFANHGREAGFFIRINGEAVLIHSTEIDGLIRYLYGMKRHSERPE